MNWVVVGGNGQLGTDMTDELLKIGEDVVSIDYPDIDITDTNSIKSSLDTVKPNIIVNCAAFTAVDLCEEKKDAAEAVNGTGAGNLAKYASQLDIPIVHISTDYVFDGNQTTPYLESDDPCPQSVYGKTKLAGEVAVKSATDKNYIFRIAWLYGVHGNNFVKTIKNIALKNGPDKPLKIVNDQFGTPTFTRDVCRQIIKTVEGKNYGLYHCTSEGECCWFDFAKYFLKKFNVSTLILPCTTEDFPRPAPRPKHSVLENGNLKKLGINIMPDWKESFDNFLEEAIKNDF